VHDLEGAARRIVTHCGLAWHDNCLDFHKTERSVLTAKRIAGRVRLSPAAMGSTHDLDLAFWLLEPAKPVRVYAQGA
jgi:hypothetical protein